MSDIRYVNKPIMDENVQITKQKLAQKQPKTLETPLTVLGQTETSVEGALGAINNKERVLTLAEYQALTPQEKLNGTTYYISDAGGDGSTSIREGYYNSTDGKFYEESTYQTEIQGQTETIYVDLNTNQLYIYQSSTTSFVAVSGGSSDNIKFGYLNTTDGKFYADSSYTTEIPANASNIYIGIDNDTIYRYDTTNTEYVAIGGGGGGNYTAGFGIDITNDDVIKTTDFVGTQAEWNALTQVQKNTYDFVNITDDTNNVQQGATGHFINNGNTEMTQRAILEFDGFNVTDDSANGITKVAEIPYTAGDGIDITNKEISVASEIAKTWTGTRAEWDAIVDKTPYEGFIINITDDIATQGDAIVVDTVENGNMNAVTSNAVYDALNDVSNVEEITSPYTGVQIFKNKATKIVQVIVAVKNIPANTYTTITANAMPHPKNNFYFICSDSKQHMWNAYIATTGGFNLYPVTLDSGTVDIIGSVTYLSE